MQAPTTNVFHYQNDILVSIDNLVELYDMLMLHFFHQFYFSFYAFSAVWFFQFVLFVNLKGYFPVCRFV